MNVITVLSMVHIVFVDLMSYYIFYLCACICNMTTVASSVLHYCVLIFGLSVVMYIVRFG